MHRHLFIFLFLVVSLLSCKDDSQLDQEEASGTAKYTYKTLNVTVDSLQYNHPLELDLNNDGVIDYYMSSVLLENNDLPYLYLFINRKSPNLNKVLVRQGKELPLNALWGVPLDKDFLIEGNLSPDLRWSDDQIKTALLNLTENGSSKIFGGEWLGKKDKYLGLKFLIKGQYHYGWLRISHTQNEAKLAILDYAFNQTAGKPVKAGEK